MESISSKVWKRKVRRMLRLLELSLYKSAPSLYDYCDHSKLQSRLRQLKEQILSGLGTKDVRFLTGGCDHPQIGTNLDRMSQAVSQSPQP